MFKLHKDDWEKFLNLDKRSSNYEGELKKISILPKEKPDCLSRYCSFNGIDKVRDIYENKKYDKSQEKIWNALLEMPEFTWIDMAVKIFRDLAIVSGPVLGLTATIALPIIFTQCPPKWRNKAYNRAVRNDAKSCCTLEEKMNIRDMVKAMEVKLQRVRGQVLPKRKLINLIANAIIKKKYDTFDYTSTSDCKVPFILIKGASGTGKNYALDAIKEAICTHGPLMTINSSDIDLKSKQSVCEQIFEGIKYHDGSREFTIQPKLFYFLNMLQDTGRIGFLVFNEIDKYYDADLGEKFRGIMDIGELIIRNKKFKFQNVIIICTSNWNDNIRDANNEIKHDSSSSLIRMNMDVSLENRMDTVIFENLKACDYKEIFRDRLNERLKTSSNNIDIVYDESLLDLFGKKLEKINHGTRPIFYFLGLLNIKIITKMSEYGILSMKKPVSDEDFKKI